MEVTALQENNKSIISDETNASMDALEKELTKYPLPLKACPLDHTLTDTQYIREIFMPAGMVVTSKIHLTEHPYFIMQGCVSVWTEEEGEVVLFAPHKGITKAGTRRALFIHENCWWITVHSRLPNETIEEIEARIIEFHENELLTKEEQERFKAMSKLGLDSVKYISSPKKIEQ